MRTIIISLLLSALCRLTLPAQTATERIYLSGTDAGHTEQWSFRCSAGMNSGRWRKIAVPSCWEQQGFGEYTYGRYYKKPGGRVSTETGHYRHTFRVPASWHGRKVEIVFEGVMTDAAVTVNGQTAGPEHQGGFTAFSYDISRLLHYGKVNTLEVKVDKQSKDKSVNAAERRADWWLFGGIYRPVYLRALPAAHIAHAAIDARADGTLRIALTTEGTGHGSYSVQAAIDDRPAQTLMLEESSDGNDNYNGDNIHNSNHSPQTLTTQWPGVSTWDPEHPRLHTLTLRLIAPDGTVCHETTQRVGFRTIEFRRRDGFYLNGTKLTIKGVNRHCFYPETGRATPRSLDIEDVKLVKAMNANAIRSHYPPDAHLLDICDSLGVLYLNELPGWQNHYSTAIGSRIVREMVMHDANHPCIFAWANGNEGGFNTALDTLFARYDLQHRHVIHPWALFDGVDAHHYPAYQTGVARLANGNEVFMPTEFLHSQYDKGAGTSLDEYWANWSRNPLFAGGFIWALIDEGVARTDRGGRIDTDGTNAPDGIVGPHREREASWYTVRDVWSPIQIAPLRITPSFDGTFKVTNGFLFSRLGECRMTYEVVRLHSPLTSAAVRSKNGGVLSHGTVALPDIAPGETGTARMALSENFAAGDLLRLTAYTAGGDTINTWSYAMRYADEYWVRERYGKAVNGGLDGKKLSSKVPVIPMNPQSLIPPISPTSPISSGTLFLEAAGVRAGFSHESGMLTVVSVDGKAVPFGGGPLPVGMKMRLLGISRRTEGNDALLVMKYAGAVDSIVWRMTPDGMLGMDAVLLNSRDGKRFGEAFFDTDVRNFGFSFSYPESQCTGMRWMGRGPYRVWRNRQRGQNAGIWQKDYNNTITGQPESGRLIYPEFKGYHANLYWAQIQSATAPFTVYSETDGLYFRVFTPEEPTDSEGKKVHTMQQFPAGDLSFLFDIPGMRSYKPIEQLGPQAQPSHIRINKGDEGLRMKLWFDFKKPMPAPVFITAGQSNTDGRVYADEMPDYLRTGYRHLHYADVTNKRNGKFSNRSFEKNRGRWSYCDVVNKLLDNSQSTGVYSIKAAVGGTSIDTVAGGPKRPSWYAGKKWLAANNAYSGNVATGRSLTKALTEGFALCVDSTLSRLEHGYDVKAIMWHQGESDRSKADSYYTNFKTMICYLREAISKKTGRKEYLTLPFIFGTVPHASRQYSAGVEAAQRRVAAELPNVYIIDLSKAQLGKDNLHFAGDWTERIGRMMYNVLVRIGAVRGNEVDTGE